MENKENVKSAYLTLLILGIIEAVLTRFAGNLIAIAVFITGYDDYQLYKNLLRIY